MFIGVIIAVPTARFVKMTGHAPAGGDLQRRPAVAPRRWCR